MKRVACVLVAGWSLWLTTAGAKAQTRALEDAVGHGITAYFQGQAFTAEQLLNAALEAGSRDPQARYFLGLARWQLGRTDEARADFAAGAQLEAAAPGLYRISARSLERIQGRARQALQQARSAARTASASQREQNRLAQFDLQTGKGAGGEQVPAPTAVAATATPMPAADDPFAPKPAKTPMPAAAMPAADPFAPKTTTPAPTTPAPMPTTPATTPVAVAAPLTLPETPELLYQEIVKQTANGRADIFWHMLPAKHQADIKTVINEFGSKMDPELWNKSLGLLGKVSSVIKDKREFIVGHPTIAGLLANAKINNEPAKPEQVAQVLEVTGSLLNTLFTSEISTVEGLAKLDPQAFLTGTVSRMLATANDTMVQLSGKTKDELVQETLTKSKVTSMPMGDDAVELTFETEGVPPQKSLWKKVDGKWLPAQLVDGWDAGVAQAKASIAAADFAGAQKTQVLGVFGFVEPVVDQLQSAADQDAFNGVINGFLPLVQGLLGGFGMPPGM